ncbi:MAG: type II secretion system F family protein [Acidimicrobiia bacterium]
MRNPRLLLVAFLALVAVLPGVALAQTSGAVVEIVNVNEGRFSDNGRVTFVIEFRNLIEPLDPAQLQLTENGVPIEDAEIDLISNVSVPQGVVLVIDSSGSMAGPAIEAAKTAAKSFVAQKRAEDFIALVTFSDAVQVLSNFTTSRGTLNAQIDGIVAEGGTAMYDGIIRGTELFSSSTDQIRKNMIVLSDGLDENSTAALADAIAAVDAAGIRTFGVALESTAFAPDELQSIVAAADGLFLSTPDPDQLSSLYSQIQQELGNTLVVRYNSDIANPGEIELGVQYGALQTAREFVSPGYVVSTTVPAGPTTTTTLVMAAPIVIESTLPIDAELVKIGAAGLIGVTTALFLFVLFGGRRDKNENTYVKRLAAYGRRERQDEKKPFFQWIPLVGRFTRRAEEEVKKRGLLGAVNATLEQANIAMTAGEAILTALGISVVLGVLTALFTFNIITGVIVAVISVLLVLFTINFVGKREKKKFEKQLPDTLTLLSTSLRAGYSLLQAVEAVASEAPNPTAREFSRAFTGARLGVSVTEALDGITERTQSEDWRWAAMAIEIQREVGGNLSEVLQTVADTMLARNRLKGEISALTAEGKISAVVLGSLPFVMGLFLWTTNREYLQPLFDETFGRIALGFGLLLIGAGIFWLRKIIDIKV